MTGTGVKARTDKGESGGIAWSGYPWFGPTMVPCEAVYPPPRALEGATMLRFDALKADILRAAQRAATKGSERAVVLLENYRPTVERLLEVRS
jgi:hypothetical protein